MSFHAKRVSTFVAAAAMLLLMAAPALAQRDAGAKIRGEYSFGSRAAQSGTYSGMSSTQQRSFSYEPAQASYAFVADRFHVGDKVAVTSDDAKLMSGSDTRGTLHKGATFEVKKIEGPWLLAQVELDGKQVTGWVWYGRVQQQASTETAARPQPATTAQRSFSYEPTTSVGQGSVTRRRATWQYPKTDPRRYRP